MPINIGNGNKIKKSKIIDNSTINSPPAKENFFKSHPVITGIIIALLVSLITALGFWQQILEFLANFRG